ncbi:MAG: hypothetical protein U0573_15670 [Phycisphaerales bacterium]|nr:hypothetical protein [Planctomycetota bacterium]
MSLSPSASAGILFKLCLVVLSIGLCALSMLAMRQARLQAAHEVAQTQLRIQRADERLWKIRADIAALSNPSRIRELAGAIGPMHALITPGQGAANPSLLDSIPMVEHLAQPAQKHPTGQPARPGAKPESKPEAKPGAAKPKAKPESKADEKPLSVSPTGLAAAPARHVLPR